jgi:hypothetical protein
MIHKVHEMVQILLLLFPSMTRGENQQTHRQDLTSYVPINHTL